MMGVHSTLFGPVKYAYLPQHLNERELVGGNGMIEMGTFVAILVGTIVGGELADLGPNGPVAVAAVCLVVAIVGRVVVGFVPTSPSDQPDLKINWNPFTETWRNLRLARQNRAVFLSLLGISWLWFFGATFLTSFFNFAKDVLGGDPQVVTLLLAMFSIGIGIGVAALRAAVARQGRDRTRAGRLDRHDGVRGRPLLRVARAASGPRRMFDRWERSRS